MSVLLLRKGLAFGSGRRASSILAFSDKDFDTSSYSAFRPTYGEPLFAQLLAYHQGSRDLAVDLGCGTGQITAVLANHFKQVHGYDTSKKMITQATQRDNIKYATSAAESLDLDDHSVDCVTVGQAAHWFDHERWYTEMSRILRPNGTLSFWSYNEAVFTDSKEATNILTHYFHADDKLGPYWP